jgi:hypothetical protein
MTDAPDIGYLFSVEFIDRVYLLYPSGMDDNIEIGDIITLVVVTSTSKHWMSRTRCGYCSSPSLFIITKDGGLRCKYCFISRTIRSLDPMYYGYKKAINVKYVTV